MKFECNEELINFLSSKKLKYIGHGAEAYCYLGKDNLVYKIYSSLKPISKRIIMKNDYNLDSFIFPSKVILLRNKMQGVVTDYVKKDLFDFQDIDQTIYQIDYKRLLEAYYSFLDQLKVLSNDNILCNDIENNLLFDGNKIYAIDTEGYTKSTENTYNINKDNIKYMIWDTLNQGCNPCAEYEEYPKNLNIEDYIHFVDEETKFTKKIIKSLSMSQR